MASMRDIFEYAIGNGFSYDILLRSKTLRRIVSFIGKVDWAVRQNIIFIFTSEIKPQEPWISIMPHDNEPEATTRTGLAQIIISDNTPPSFELSPTLLRPFERVPLAEMDPNREAQEQR